MIGALFIFKMHNIDEDRFWMQQALTEAKKGLFSTYPNPRVGCVIIKNKTCIGRGFHEQAGEPHAEVFALKAAGDQAQGATAYVTLEPCAHYGRTPPCAEALVKSGVKRVVIACTDPNPKVAGKGIQILKNAGIEVTVGILESEALLLNRPFFHRILTGTPWLTLKLACSMDGKTALENGESQWITGQEARADVHYQRAQADVIIAGTGSVIVDNARLDARINSTLKLNQPLRVIIDSQLATPKNATLFDIKTPILMATTKNKSRTDYPSHAIFKSFDDHKSDKVNLEALIQYLGKQQYNHVLIESGAALAGAFLSHDLINEILLYQAPCFLGSNARELVMLSPLQSLSDKMQFRISESMAIGEDWRFSLLKK